MVTPAIGTIINGVQFETSPMRAIANIETISPDAIEYPRDDDEASAGWVGEQEDRPETGTPKAGMQRIPVHELYANPKVTQKLLEDNAWNVESWLGNKIGDKFGRTEANAFVVGNGVKKPRGFATYASGTYVAGGSGKIEQIAAAAAGLIGWDDLINILTALKEFYLGGSKLPVAFGNFKMGYTIVDRVGISTLRDPYSAKPFVQFYTRKRVGGDVTNFEAIKLLAT